MKIQGISHSNLNFTSTYKVAAETNQLPTFVAPQQVPNQTTQRDTNSSILEIIGQILGRSIMSPDSYDHFYGVKPELDYYA